MAVFSVHLPGSGNAADAAFVRDGFCAAAFVFGPCWLLARGLWLFAALWIAAALGILSLVSGGLLSGGAGFELFLLAHLLLGLEANRLIEERLARQGYDFAGLVAAPERDGAELAFFRRIGAPDAQAPGPRTPAPRTPQGPAGVIGSLPTPEA